MFFPAFTRRSQQRNCRNHGVHSCTCSPAHRPDGRWQWPYLVRKALYWRGSRWRCAERTEDAENDKEQKDKSGYNPTSGCQAIHCKPAMPGEGCQGCRKPRKGYWHTQDGGYRCIGGSGCEREVVPEPTSVVTELHFDCIWTRLCFGSRSFRRYMVVADLSTVQAR